MSFKWLLVARFAHQNNARLICEEKNKKKVPKKCISDYLLNCLLNVLNVMDTVYSKQLMFSKITWILAAFFIAFLYGLHNYMFKNETNLCDMTYMYQFPQFIPVKLKDQVVSKFPNYNLYIYGEGEYAMYLSEGALFGLPILFVPGSGGSYKQVRSLGSIALRMAEEYSLPYHLNFFTIDFNEELSALYGPKLNDQTEFLYEAVAEIERLYSRSTKKASLIVVGHSIGGLISRGVLTKKGSHTRFIDLLITLAAPHKRPAVFFDSYTTKYYDKINSFWSKHRNSSHLKHLSIISIGGGFNDKLVKSELTSFDDLNSDLGDAHLVATSINDLWLSTDHLSIVWCRQLILKLTSLIFDLIDDKMGRVTTNSKHRAQIISYHLMNRNRGVTKNQVVPYRIVFPKKGIWITYEDRYFTFQRSKHVIDSTFLLIPLLPKTNVVLLTNNVQRNDWLFVCNVTSKMVNGSHDKYCDEGHNFSLKARLVYKTQNSERKFFKYDASWLISHGFDHLAVYIGPTAGPVSIVGERYATNKRNRAIIMPSIFHSIISFWSTPSVILNIPVSEESIFYNLTLVGLNQIWHCYDLRVEVNSCYQNAFETGIIHFWIPWSREDILKPIDPVKGRFTDVILKLNIPKDNQKDSRHPHLYLMLEPNCGYSVKMKLSYIEVATQLIRHYFNVFLPLLGAIFLPTFSILIVPKNQASILKPMADEKFYKENKKEIYYPVSTILLKKFHLVSIYGIIPIFPCILSHLTWYIPALEPIVFNGVHPFKNDHLSFVQQLSLETLLYISSYSVIYFFAILVELLVAGIVKLFSIIQASLPQPFLFKIEDEEPKAGFNLWPFMVMFLVFVITCITCSALGLSLVILAYLLKSIQSSFTYHQLGKRKGASLCTTIYNLYLGLFILTIIALIPSVPSAIVWYKEYFMQNKFGRYFTDIHLNYSSIIILSSGFLLQLENNLFIKRRALNFTSFLIKIFALLNYCLGLIAYDYVSLIMAATFLHNAFYRLYCLRYKKSDEKQD